MDNIKYELLNYSKYKDRLSSLLSDETLNSYGLTKSVIGKTAFGFDIDCITVGRGNKHLFIVGGTHGNEIISVDFVTQLMSNIKYFDNFDPNEFTLFIIPNQNPEGFSVTTDVLSNSNLNDFEKDSYDYYFRYKLDNIINFFVRDLDKFFKDCDGISEVDKISKFKFFIERNTYSNLLLSLVDGFDIFVDKIRNTNNVDNLNLYLSFCCNSINANNKYLNLVMKALNSYFINNSISFKLHQDKFSDCKFSYINNKLLRESVRSMYKLYHHPIGSLVTFDATGVGINLNANNRDNPGIEYMRSGKIKMGLGARSNVRNYTPGPLGIPTLDADKFEYAIENRVMYNLIKKSYDSGNYVGTLLYHGTGGSIYFEPDNKLVDRYNNDYESFLSYNSDIANIYSNATGYKLNKWSESTGYGDHLRAKFPGVLMIELSKMGGNPIAPYGDNNNINRTINDNLKALNNLLGYFLKMKVNKNGMIRR